MTGTKEPRGPRDAPLSLGDALNELNRLHRLYSEYAGIVGNFDPARPQLNQTQKEAFEQKLPTLRERLHLCLAFYQEAARARDAEVTNRLASRMFWLTVAIGGATLVQAIAALLDLCGYG